MEQLGKLRPLDLRLLDSLFGMGGGYVLDFSNRTFAEFFKGEINIDIDDSGYAIEGGSKGKRLRYFLKNCSQPLLLKTLLALWEYRETSRRISQIEETIPNAESEFFGLIERLGGRRPSNKPSSTATEINHAITAVLKNKLLAVSKLEAQARGYAYERFLKDLFDANGLSARASFRIAGEQIDGSFELAAETYLLEAKWTGHLIGVGELRSFNAKVEEKAAWSRGLFVSDSGFTPDGIEAFGRGKRIVCMDGLDIYDMLDRNLTFSDVLAKKVRRAAESGNPFIRVRDLYS